METLLELIQTILVLILMLFGGQDTDRIPSASLPDGSNLQVHYIDVGQANAALILCDGEAMLIDGGNKEDSSLLYSYLKSYDVDHLDYVINTHAHEDHVGGLPGALNYATADVVMSAVTSYDSRVFTDFVKTVEGQGLELTVPYPKDSFTLGNATVQILHVDPDNKEPNNTGIVLRMDYGDTSFLFTGDAEHEVEDWILENGYNVEATVLQVGHHGSDTSTSYRWLYEVDPEYAVISVGEGNSYGHPHKEVISRLNDADVDIYRTDLDGTVICVSDGESVWFTTER